MARLDIEEAEACEASTMIDAKTALDYLADLPGLWRKTAPPSGDGTWPRLSSSGLRSLA
jgi:hypothetical protein